MAVEVPKTHRALKAESAGKVVLLEGQSLPHFAADEVLVHVAAVSLNPFDSKSLDLSVCIGATIGADFSGEVAALGASVTSLQLGDRVFGCMFGNNPDDRDNGAFAEFVAVPASLVFKFPESITFQQAATLGVGIATAGLVLYQRLGLPLPNKNGSRENESPDLIPGSKVLVYGGGTATGALAIQLLRGSGLIPITTCSPRNFKHVKSLGAEEAFDYQSPTCGESIREYTKNKLAFAMDCISNASSMKICYEAIGPNGGKYVALDPFPLNCHDRRSIEPDWVFMFTLFGKHVNWARPYNFDPRPKDRVFADIWYRLVEELLKEGKISPPPHQEEQGGLQAVSYGIDALRKGQVSGYKLVYPIRSF